MTDQSRFMIGASSETPQLESGSVALAVTSPLFLDVVDCDRRAPANNQAKGFSSALGP